MEDFRQIKKLIRKTAKIEEKLPNEAKIALAKKKLQKIAGTDEPQEYGDQFGQQDKTDVSSTIMEDENVEEIIENMDDEERHVFEALSKKIGKKKLLRIAQEFEESKHKRDESGQFTSNGEGKKEKQEKPKPKESKFEGVSDKQVKSIESAEGVVGSITDVKTGMIAGNGVLVETDEEGAEYAVYDSVEDAREAAKEQLENLWDDLGAEGWNKDFVDNHQFISDTDKRLLAQDLGEADRDAIEDELRDEGLEGDRFDEEVESRVAASIDRHQDELDGDPKEYLVNDLGLFSEEDYNKQNYVQTDVDALIEESIDVDGIAHTLSSFDGEEIETDDGQLLYRIN